MIIFVIIYTQPMNMQARDEMRWYIYKTGYIYETIK